jgi:predicted RNA-binding protein
MCLSKAYLGRDGEMELLFEEVASLQIEKGKILLKTFFGEQKEIRANMKEVDFLGGKMFLEKSK